MLWIVLTIFACQSEAEKLGERVGVISCEMMTIITKTDQLVEGSPEWEASKPGFDALSTEASEISAKAKTLSEEDHAVYMQEIAATKEKQCPEHKNFR